MIKQQRDLRLTTPRSAAVAGIVFALLFAASLTFIRLSIPGDLSSEIDWIARGRERLSIALILMPFAGIAFLWFIGVIRDRLGDVEEHFFSTIFLGSGLLFLAMVFVAMANAGAILSSAEAIGDATLQTDVIIFGRAVMLQISNVYALRMAGVFMISLGTAWLRTGLMPRWLIVLTYLLALLLLFVVSLSVWMVLVFPGWVLFVSVYILSMNLHRQPRPAG
jgi:hypothetical protein